MLTCFAFYKPLLLQSLFCVSCTFVKLFLKSQLVYYFIATLRVLYIDEPLQSNYLDFGRASGRQSVQP